MKNSKIAITLVLIFFLLPILVFSTLFFILFFSNISTIKKEEKIEACQHWRVEAIKFSIYDISPERSWEQRGVEKWWMLSYRGWKSLMNVDLICLSDFVDKIQPTNRPTKRPNGGPDLISYEWKRKQSRSRTNHCELWSAHLWKKSRSPTTSSSALCRHKRYAICSKLLDFIYSHSPWCVVVYLVSWRRTGSEMWMTTIAGGWDSQQRNSCKCHKLQNLMIVFICRRFSHFLCSTSVMKWKGKSKKFSFRLQKKTLSWVFWVEMNGIYMECDY